MNLNLKLKLESIIMDSQYTIVWLYYIVINLHQLYVYIVTRNEIN